MRRLLTLLTCFAIFISGAIAQSKKITGKIIDEKGSPVPNASVVVKGTKIGTSTLSDGTFELSVPGSAKALVITSIGFALQDVSILNKSSITLTLLSASQSLDEVVVTGYGTQKRKDVISDISTVKGDAVANKPNQSFDEALGGRASGVQITTPNGVLNNAPVFRIRGTNSISLSSYPLIVIDGVPTYTGNVSQSEAASNPLSSINPSDIESIDVLKDAAATAIYGSRAANGVVIVTTKKGRRGKTKVSYDGWVGWTKAYRLYKLLDADQYIKIKNEGRENSGLSDAYFSTNGPDGKPINTDWYDFIYHTGVSHSHTVSISGANDNTSYYLSAGYTDQDGIIKKNTYERKSIRFNIDHRLNKVASIGANLNYANEIGKAAVTSGSLDGEAFNTAGLGRLALILPPDISAYNNDGTYNLNGSAIGAQNNLISISYPNPAPLMDNNHTSTENNHIQGNLFLQVKPIQDITLRTQYGVDYLSSTSDNFATPLNGDYYPTGGAWDTYSKYNRWIWTTTGQYDHVFAGLHTLSVLLGTEQQYTQTSGFGLYRQGISDAYYSNIQGGWTSNDQQSTTGNLGQNYLVSNFARLNYDFGKKYFIGGSFRRDGYSAFAAGKKYGDFWSVSAAWDIANENFWKNSSISKVVNTLRLRGSYGTVGNISGIGDFASFSFYSTGLYNGAASLYYSQAGNSNLTWETSKKNDIGINFGLFNNKLTGEVAYYKNNVDGLIINVPQSASTGLPGLSVPTNVGSMYNKGWEITLGASPLKSKEFVWNTSVNITFNKNMVTALASGVPNIISATSGLENTSITLPGYSIGQIFVIRTHGVDPQTGDRIYVNKNGDEVLLNFPSRSYIYRKNGSPAPAISQATDGVPYANTSPKYYGGWDNTFTYKNFDLNLLITYQGGFSVYNGTYASLSDQRFWNNTTDVLRRWQKPGDITDIPKLYYGDNLSGNGSANPMSANVQKGDFIKFRTLSLGYTFKYPQTANPVFSSARLYVSAQNLGIITKYKGSDPEVSSNGNDNNSQGVDRNSVANGRVFTIGLNVNF